MRYECLVHLFSSYHFQKLHLECNLVQANVVLPTYKNNQMTSFDDFVGMHYNSLKIAINITKNLQYRVTESTCKY